jgi:hypothetical protein
MMQQIIRFLFPSRRERTRCQNCWLLEDCNAYLETGVIDYLPDKCPNRPIGMPARKRSVSATRTF